MNEFKEGDVIVKIGKRTLMRVVQVMDSGYYVICPSMAGILDKCHAGNYVLVEREGEDV